MSIDRDGLALALRQARARVRPEDVGLPAGLQRRVPGLRREELAMLAGISVDYVVRLEQARGPRPSAQVMTAVARALRLADAERDHVFQLAGVAAPQPGTIDLLVRPSVLRLIDRFVDLPAMVLSAKGDVLAWNAMSAALLGDWSALPPERRNHPRLRFLPEPGDPPVSVLGGSPQEQLAAARHTVASLRTASGRYPRDAGLRRLLHDLLEGSAEFRRLWSEATAGDWSSHTKTVRHPSLGDVRLDCETLHVPDTDQRLVVYSAPPGTAAADALALLRVVGLQRLQADDLLVEPGPVRR